jgi:hypothetical protein
VNAKALFRLTPAKCEHRCIARDGWEFARGACDGDG